VASNSPSGKNFFGRKGNYQNYRIWESLAEAAFPIPGSGCVGQLTGNDILGNLRFRLVRPIVPVSKIVIDNTPSVPASGGILKRTSSFFSLDAGKILQPSPPFGQQQLLIKIIHRSYCCSIKFATRFRPWDCALDQAMTFKSVVPIRANALPWRNESMLSPTGTLLWH